MAVAGVEADTGRASFTPSQASQESLQRAVDISEAATWGNYTGPIVLPLPLYVHTTVFHSHLGISFGHPSYASTTTASLVLYQALSISMEHLSIVFACVLPSTVEGDFRASAVDVGPVRKKDSNEHRLKREDVARQCIAAVDAGESLRTVSGGGASFVPALDRFCRMASADK
ncbi:hypothetical protein H0H92_006388, partial [Tricholoma furcatifolium]